MGTLSYYGGRDKHLHLDGAEVLRLVSNHTQLPEYVSSLVRQFQLDSAKTALNRPVIRRRKRSATGNQQQNITLAIHWRWNFELHYDKSKPIGERGYTAGKFVESVLTNPELLANAIFNYITLENI